MEITRMANSDLVGEGESNFFLENDLEKKIVFSE
jgi:hypothetical protein